MAISLQKSARWYVYRLIDPRDQKPFYIGKGCGSRIHAHEADAARGVCSKKTFKIKDIQNAGFEVVKCFDAYFWDEQAAYDHETDVILEIGLSNLTNILPGGQKAWVQRVEDRQQRAIKDIDFAKWIKSNASILLPRLANWLHAGGHNGAQFAVVPSSKEIAEAFKFHIAITEISYNKVFPMLWEKIVKCERSIGFLIDALKPYGVELVYGRP